MIARSAPSYSPAARPPSSAGGRRRQRAHGSGSAVRVLHDGSGSPQLRQKGGRSVWIDDQHESQTGPADGRSSGRSQAAQFGDSTSVRIVSSVARPATRNALRGVTTKSPKRGTRSGQSRTL